ncbi:MAG TPA: hypothetical protein VFU68_02955, partial [Terracidiphilus sp.]|nr:hypothetical protein [Terracidiphilus sp.]
PHLGSLPSLTATFPHPNGEIRVEYHRTAAGISASITLPAGLSGSFVYAGRTQTLHPGLNRLTSASAPPAPKMRTAALQSPPHSQRP